MITIKDTLGNVRFSTEINTGSRRKFSLMSEDYIVLKFSVEDPVYFKLGDYTDTELGLFELVDLYKPTLNDSTGAYDYELRLDAHYYKWKNKIFKFNPEVGGSEAGWKLTATLDVHLGVFLRNLSALGYTYKGTPFEVNIDSTVAKTSKLIVYDNTNLIDALTQMAETWECEWWVEDNQIRFGRCEFGDPVDFVINENVERMPREESKATFATRVYAFGSTRNIPNDYRPVDESVVVNGIVQKRLMMPTGVPYVDAYLDMTTEEAVEDVVIFDYIYPRRTGTMSSVTPVERTENVENEGSTTQQKYTVYQFKDTGITFSKDYILPGEELRIVFQTGVMAGMDFAVTFNPDNLPEKLEDGSWNPQAQLWEIVRNEDYGRMLPADTLIPSNGDTYNLYGFDSTSPVFEDMIKRAEEELEEKARDYVEKTKIDPNTYPCTMMSDYMYNDGNVRTNEFTVGARINLINPAYFENGRVSRVIGFEFDLDIPYFSPTFTIGETASYSRIGEIEDKVDELTYKGQVFTGTGSGVYVIGTNDNTPPTNKNVYSALKILREFVRYQGWVDQPVRKSDAVKFNSVTSTDFESKLKGWIIDALGNAEFRDVLLRSFKSWNFAAGPLGAGVGMVNDDELQTDKLLVRKIMYVLEMMIQRMRFQGGIMVLSPATGFKIDRVETFDTYYRVYCRPEDFNEFEVNDQARIQNFTGNNIKYLWSLVLSRGDDYIDISRVDKDGEGVPAEGDEIVQLGNRTNPDRQDAVLLSAVNGEVGIFTYYGINSFDLSNKEGSWLGKHGGKKGAVIRGEVHITAGSSGLEQFDEYEDVDKRIQDAKDLADSVQDVVNNLTSIIIPDMQGQIDGSIMSHEGKVPPTLTNEPAVNWTTEEEKNRHIGDYYDYYLTVDGEQVTERYKFSKVNGTYQWVRVADSGSALAASVAREALGLAGTKATITWGNTLPEAPYNINDMWIKLDGSMYICNHQRLDGETGSQSDWQLFNDTMLRLAKMADDNVITKEEKATLRDTWNQIQKEFTAYQAQATKYGVSITALQNAYNTLNTFLSNTVKILSTDEDTNLSVAQKTEYNQDFANYYSERTAFANVIAQKVADESVGNLQIGGINLADYSGGNFLDVLGLYDRSYASKTKIDGKNCLQFNRNSANCRFAPVTVENGEYTFSLWVKGSEEYDAQVDHYNGSNYGSTTVHVTTSWERKVITFTAKAGSDIIHFGTKNTIYITDWKYEKGNKATDWSPSIADQNRLSREIAKAEAELAETKANAYADGIVTEAEQNAINEAQARLDALKIGSVNLVSRKMLLDMNNTTNGSAIWGQDSDGIYISVAPKDNTTLYSNFKNGTQYVISVNCKGNPSGDSLWRPYLNVEYTDGTMESAWRTKDSVYNRHDYISKQGKTIARVYWNVENSGQTYSNFIYDLAVYEGNKVLADIPPSFEDSVDNLQVGSVSLVSRKMMLNWNNKKDGIAVWGQDSDGIYLGINQGALYTYVCGGTAHNDLFGGTIKYKDNTQYVFQVKWKLAGEQTNNNSGVSFWALYTDGTSDGIRLGSLQTSLIVESLITKKGKTVEKIFSSYGDNVYRSLIYSLALYEGNKVLSEPPVATEDLTGQSNVNLVDGGKEVTVASNSYSTLKVPVLKPNTVYTVRFTNVEVISGDTPSGYEFRLYDTKISANYATVKIKAGDNHGILITSNNFTVPIEGRLLFYPGIQSEGIARSVKYTEIMLVEGFTPPSSYSPSPGDVAKDIKDVSDAVSNLDTTINTTFKDGIISEAEAKAIASNINVLNAEKADIDAYYNKLHANAYLTGTAKTNLASAKTAYNTAHTNLINSINTAIADGKTTATEKADVDAKFTAYNNALSAYQTRVGEADKAIQDTIKKVADDAQTSANAAQSAADAAQSAANQAQADANAANSKLTTWASDNYISPQEKTALRQQKSDIQAEYNDIVANANRYNISLTSYSTAYNSAIAALNKYTATSPENIAVSSDYNNIAAYYPARQTILNSIAAAAKAQADKATGAIGMDGGKMLYADPEFKKGLNGVVKYTNSSNVSPDYIASKLTVERVTKPSDAPTQSGYCLKVTCKAAQAPGYGGVHQSITSRANAVFVQKIIAKIPVGYKINTASNSMGTGYTDTWLTPTEGTGKYTTYLRKVVCGTTGNFSTGGHVCITGSPAPTESAPLEWYIAYMTAFDLTADGYGDIEYNAKDDLAQQLGYSNFDKMVENASKGETIIKGAYINTQLIDVETLVADTALVDKLTTRILTTDSITANMISVGGFEFQNGQIYGGSDFGVGPGVKITSKDSERSFKAYKDTNNYISMFYNSANDWGLKGVVGGSTVFQLGNPEGEGTFIGPFNFTKTQLVSSSDVTIGTSTYKQGFTLENNKLSFNRAVSSIYQRRVEMGIASTAYGSDTLLAVEGGDIWHQGTVTTPSGSSYTSRSCRFYSSDIHMRGIMKMYNDATITDYDGNVVIKNGISGGKIKDISIYGTSNTIASDYKVGLIGRIGSSGCNTTLSPGEFIGQIIYLLNYTTSSCNLMRNDDKSKMAKLGGQKTAILYYNGTTWLPIAIINTYEL